MIVPASSSDKESQRKALDRFNAMAYNSPELMRFVNIASDAFDRKGTMKLALHIKQGEPKGGEGFFSF